MALFAFTFLTLAFLTAIFLAWYFTHKTREKERLILIEKGVDISTLPEPGKVEFRFRFPWLKVGVILTAAMIGLVIGSLVESKLNIRTLDLAPIFMLLFGGIGMILSHFLDKPDEPE